jgi:transposase
MDNNTDKDNDNNVNSLLNNDNDDLIIKINKISDIENSKNFGTHYLLHEIAKKIKLIGILKTVFPKTYQFIFTLISFIILENDTMDKYDGFIYDNYTFPILNISSQRISELFNKIIPKERNLFYKLWFKNIHENEFLALDRASISSNSKKIEEVEYGHSKEDDKLPQINLYVLFGEQSCFPMFQTSYNGSLIDVTTL